MSEGENIMTSKHQAENPMNCTGVCNLQAPIYFLKSDSSKKLNCSDIFSETPRMKMHDNPQLSKAPSLRIVTHLKNYFDFKIEKLTDNLHNKFRKIYLLL